MQGGIDEDGLFAHVDVILEEHAQHGGQALLQSALAMDHVDHGGVQPDPEAAGGGNAFAPLLAFTDDGGGGHVAGLQGMKASPSRLTSMAPMERTFSVTSAPKIWEG